MRDTGSVLKARRGVCLDVGIVWELPGLVRGIRSLAHLTELDEWIVHMFLQSRFLRNHGSGGEQVTVGNGRLERCSMEHIACRSSRDSRQTPNAGRFLGRVRRVMADNGVD